MVWLPRRLLPVQESRAGAPHCSLFLPFQPQSSQGHKSLLCLFLTMATCAWVRGQAAARLPGASRGCEPGLPSGGATSGPCAPCACPVHLLRIPCWRFSHAFSTSCHNIS